MTSKFLKGLILIAFVFLILSCRTSKTHFDNSEPDNGVSLEIFDELPVGVSAFPDTNHFKLPAGLRCGAIFQIAVRFIPEDILSFSSSKVTGIKVYINNPATYVDVKIWQGPKSAEVLDKGQFVVYPNPTSDWLYIEANNSYEISSVALYNTLGQQLIYIDTQTHPGNREIISLNVSDLPADIYLLYLIGENSKQFQKVILE